MPAKGDEPSRTTHESQEDHVKRSLKLLPLAAATMLAMGSASATPSVSITGVDGSTLSGTAEFPPLGAESVITEFTDFSSFQPTGADDLPPEAAQALGLDLTDALIEPIVGGLRFTWVLDTPIEVIPPEGLRYNWSFTVGGEAYQLQAKLTNMGSLTTVEAPEAHVNQLTSGEPFFQLRGRCTASYEGTPVAGCYHLTFLDGAFDLEGGKISIDLPYGLEVAPDIREGATLVEAQSAGMSITASLQAVVSNATISAYFNGWGQYATAPTVSANRVPEVPLTDGEPDYTFVNFDDTMTISENGTWSGAVDGTGSVYVARACHGATCSYTSATL